MLLGGEVALPDGLESLYKSGAVEKVSVAEILVVLSPVFCHLSSVEHSLLNALGVDGLFNDLGRRLEYDVDCVSLSDGV